jgi:hypothetical protein
VRALKVSTGLWQNVRQNPSPKTQRYAMWSYRVLAADVRELSGRTA